MPGGNGTGPYGFGPGSGRRMGKCKGLLFSSGRSNSKTFGIIGALIPIFSALIRDVFNPHGFIRSFSSKRLPSNKEKNKNAIDAEYTILDDKTTSHLEKRNYSGGNDT